MTTSIVPAIIVHGGAGGVVVGHEANALAACARAAAAGLDVLQAGGPALDAVQAAVRVLEDEPEFNAGVGSALTRDGTVELDAAIMDGATRRAGAVAAVPNLRQPIDLARLVLDDGEHILLCGDGAWAFARERGIAPVAPEALVTERARQRLRDRHKERGGGTVGACAVDAAGRCAAATSTGGMTGKRPGRIGDTPLPGCGTYADEAGACSATGSGEYIIRATLGRFVVDRLRGDLPAHDAAVSAVWELASIGGDGGVICVDRRGRIGHARNTPAMPVAWATLAEPKPKAEL
ncbi:MAG TPA: isoaspartyl peptidase/L-asparaginase [Haliangiales bacterium]|nr:isoaspartyl peptidase/L-asparaginase [Haliangiales bacterium]